MVNSCLIAEISRYLLVRRGFMYHVHLIDAIPEQEIEKLQGNISK